MKWTSLNDLREKYLSFFESKGHLRLPSFSLVPNNDKSLLLINSGMAPMKKFFTGEVTPPKNRVTTCQKCIRTPDLERVGHTARHGTFFEMLGNFSFGDYFKVEAIDWAWEFLTKTLEIPENLLWPSIYENDEEAYDIWKNRIGVPEEHIVRLGKADNFWEHGSGPCGPCSEIYFDRGVERGCGSPDCKPGCDCDRFMEIWNNVFSQFNNDGKGNYTELVQKNIDTGMGLERLACVMQNVENMFEVDSVRKILDKVCEISGKKYGDDERNDISIRVVTDHTRSAMFMISDGVIPSNEGRGYVLRRIIRRACRHGKLLGINHPFLVEMCEVAIGESRDAYKELGEKADYIKKVLSLEEERFDATIDAGLSILEGLVKDAKKEGKSVLDGADAFKLYDTFGFPIDLTREIAEENGLETDMDGFNALMAEQKQRARNARANISGWSDKAKSFDIAKTEFAGYTGYECEGKVLAILDENGESVDSASEGECSVILDKTTFYGEGGGQVGDSGVISNDKCELSVLDTKKTEGVYIHMCNVASGEIRVGDTVKCAVDGARREAIMRNHSAVHMLQAALRAVLGTHVEQAGSYVDEKIGRFDFTHFAALTKEEIAKVEAIVNANILAGTAIETVETDIETARKNGAMALFGEKYGKVVRMVKMGDFSVELCGGTHLDNTAKAGMFKIITEIGVAAGTRRIEVVTGYGVLDLLNKKEELILGTANELRCQNANDIVKRAGSLQEEIRTLKKEIESLNSKMAGGKVDALLASAKKVGNYVIVTEDLKDMGVDAVRSLGDTIKDKEPNAVAVFAIHTGDKLNFIAVCGKDAVKNGAHAGNILREVSAVTGGRGGGRPDSAMSGGKDISKIADALNIVADLLK
ncbi:MAG: alanine--tRNA ligase [Ruminococcaceae bacterium]|nr:alanine--tRNA ligase [Oscillospiraceae bacterium]